MLVGISCCKLHAKADERNERANGGMARPLLAAVVSYWPSEPLNLQATGWNYVAVRTSLMAWM